MDERPSRQTTNRLKAARARDRLKPAGKGRPGAGGQRPSMERRRLTPEMARLIKSEARRGRLMLLGIAAIGAVVAVVAAGYLVRLAMTPASPASDQSSATGALFLVAVGAVAAVWAWLQLPRVSRVLDTPDAATREEYVRVIGDVYPRQYRPSGMRFLRYQLHLENGDTLVTNSQIHSALVPAATPSTENQSLTKPWTWNVGEEGDVWWLADTTILFHQPSHLIFEVRGNDGRVIYRHPRFEPRK